MISFWDKIGKGEASRMSKSIKNKGLSSMAYFSPEGITTNIAMISIDDWRDGVKSGEITEIFACGTAAVVSAVGAAKSIHGTWQTGDGKPGVITNEIRAALLGIQHGTIEDKHGWNKRVI